MQATVLDLRRNTRSILAALARNERVTVTNYEKSGCRSQ